MRKTTNFFRGEESQWLCAACQLTNGGGPKSAIPKPSWSDPFIKSLGTEMWFIISLHAIVG
eukprot:Skav215194  [mRNA]  locus=scaffold3330:126039:126399:- [translate_table: standard]